MQNPLLTLQDWLSRYEFHLLFTLAVLLIYLLIRRHIIPRLESYVERDHLKQSTLRSALFTFTLISSVVPLVVILVIWGINVRELLALSTGIIAITGVAMFATWSILSNITSFFILLSNSQYKRGNYIRIFEMDNYVEGYISQINLFHTMLITENRETVIYPNNLLTARMTMINPKDRRGIIGKIDDFREEEEDTKP